MSSVEAHLDQVFAEGAAMVAAQMAGKTYKYKLISLGYLVSEDSNGKEGTCKFLGCYYSKSLDCDVYRLLDLSTDTEFKVDQFEVSLTEIAA